MTSVSPRTSYIHTTWLPLVLSPLIALYGFAPIYLFADVDLVLSLISYSALSVSIFLFWIGNTFLFKTSLAPSLKYILSYTVILVFQTITLIVSPFSEAAQDSFSFYLYIFLSTIAANSIILLIIRSNSINRAKLEMEMELGKVKFEHSQAQVKNLLQQLQPHFLFNTLSTLKSMIAENSPDAEAYTVRLSDFLRYTVQSSSKECVTVEEELGFVYDFLSLQEKRFGSALGYHIDIPQEVLRTKIPIFALQSLVENAIKHNRFTKQNPLNIVISMNDERIKVSNNRMPKALNAPSGTGLVNLNKRYELALNRSIEIKQTDNEYAVYLHVIQS